MRLNFYLFKSTIVGALGGLLFGFDTAVIAGATHQLTDIFHLSPAALGFTVSIALWGTVIGAMSAGAIGQKLGGREALRIMAVLYVISALGCAFSWNWTSLIAFRFIAVSGKRQVEVKSLFLRGSGIAAAGVPEHQLCFKFHQILFFSRKLVLTFFGG